MSFDVNRHADGRFAPQEGSKSDVALPPSPKPLKRGQSAQMAHGESENLAVNEWVAQNQVVGVLTYVGKFRGASPASDKREYQVTIAANGRAMATPFFSDEDTAPTVADILASFAEDAENAEFVKTPVTEYERSIVENRQKLKEFLGSDYDAITEGEIRRW